MSVKRWMLAGVAAGALVLSACGSKEAEKKEEEKPAAAEKAPEKENEKEKEKEEKAEEKTADKNDAKDDKNFNKMIEERTEGDIDVLMTNNETGMEHKFSDDVTLTLDRYQIVHVENMNESAKDDFDGKEEGYVLSYELTLDNQSKEDVYFTSSVDLLADDGVDHIIKRVGYMDRDDWMKDESNDNASQFSAGKSFTGIFAHTMTKAQYEKLKSPTLTVDKPWLDDDVTKTIGENAVFKLPFNEEGAEKAEASGKLYQDRMVTDSIADKELFYEKTDIGKTEEVDGLKVTLEGVQYANVVPAEGYQDSFKDFGDENPVALTAKITVENGSDQAIAKDLMHEKLIVDDNRTTYMSQGTLQPRNIGMLEAGAKEEFLTVFLMRKDEFSIYKKLELQYGPFTDDNAKPLFKEKKVKFDLPMKK